MPSDRSAATGLCDLCTANTPGCTALRSWAFYSGSVRNAIHRLKYGGDIALAEVLARPMMDLLAREDWQVDAVIPVPISSSRRTERGYNQAALLARPVALQAGLEYKPHQLEKVRDTRSQVHLSAVERRTNVAGAFAARGSVSGLNILVIDDVTTSGATLNECAAALFSAGAAHVYGLTLARAERVIHS